MVAAQFAMMLALLVAGPLWHGQCPGKAALAIGGALVLAGAWLGIAGVRVLGMNRTPFPEPKPGSQLITTGIYARVRHPLYASVIALGFGWAMLWSSGPALALAAAQVVFFYGKARFEERLLRERFAEYADYTRRVPFLFGWAVAIVLFLGFVPFAPAESPAPFDDTRLPRQVQRIDGVLVPVPNEIFRALEAFRDSNWQPVLRPDLATMQTTGISAQIALSLGLVIAEGFLAVAAEDATAVEDLGKAALKLARALGVEKSVLARGNSIIDHAGKKDWVAVREEWSGVNADLKEAMVEIGSEPLSQLVSLGGWLRGAEALSALVSQHYSTEAAQLLHQPVLLDYFGKRVSQMEDKIRADPAVIEMEKGIIRLRPLFGSENQTPISAQQVKEIRTIAAELVKSIDTRTR